MKPDVSHLHSISHSRPSLALKDQLLARLKTSLDKSQAKGKYSELFLSSKNPKSLIQAFNTEFQKEVRSVTNQQEFREKFFKETLMKHLQSKQYKRRKNAFYILAYLVQSDPIFPQVALKQFHKIKDTLFRADQLPDLTTLEMTSDFLKFKIFVTQKIHDWADKHSAAFPDLFLWKKIQSQFLQGQHLQYNTQTGAIQDQKFEEKFAQLKIYRVIFERNKRETEKLREEFLKIRYECSESKRLMVGDLNTIKFGDKSQQETELINKEEEKVPQDGNLAQGFYIEQSPTREEQEEALDFLNDLMAQDSTQINAPEMNVHQPAVVHQFAVEDRYLASSKNVTLYRVLNDNRKSLERRIMPLLEMFKVETTFFKQLQGTCMSVVNEKKQLDSLYTGKIKITKKDIQDFDEKYQPISDDDIASLLKTLDALLRQVTQLKEELEIIRLKQDTAGGLHHASAGIVNEVQICDEDDIIPYEARCEEDQPEDSDEALFR